MDALQQLVQLNPLGCRQIFKHPLLMGRDLFQGQSIQFSPRRCHPQRIGPLVALDRRTSYQVSLLQLGTIATNRTAQYIANEIATWTGTALIRECDLQRYFRDTYTGITHLVCSPPVHQEVGRQLAGRAADDAYWAFYDLIEPSFEQ